MAHVSVAIQDCNGKLQALCLDFPVLFEAQLVDLVADVQDALCIHLGNCIQHIQRVHSDVDLWVLKTDQGIV